MTPTVYVAVMLGVILLITIAVTPSLFRKKCSECGARNSLDAKTCAKCGAPFADA